MNRPNLFSYATSELSQDAFICWLLSWASPEHKETDHDLHCCAIALIHALFKKHSKKVPNKIEKVDISKQDERIDVLCIINETFAIIIEDKTGTEESKTQLADYLAKIRKREYKEENILPTYFKTQDQGSYARVRNNGYQPFLRSDFLNTLNSYKGENQILQDYRFHLQSISDKVESYKTLSLVKWNWHSWIGFYLELQKKLGTGNWGYVANPSGGFLGFHWHWQGDKGTCRQFLHIEGHHSTKIPKLCFKIEVADKLDKQKRAQLRGEWNRKIIKKCTDSGLKAKKPARFGNGKNMTVAVIEDFFITDNNGIVDFDKTITVIKKVGTILAECDTSLEM